MATILAEGILKCIIMYENDQILRQISLKSVLGSPIDKMWALVQVMAWRWIGNKPLTEPMMAQFADAYMRH